VIEALGLASGGSDQPRSRPFVLEETESESGIGEMGIEHVEKDLGFMNIGLRRTWVIEEVPWVRQFKGKHPDLITRAGRGPNCG
jgi:hypothetical protein